MKKYVIVSILFIVLSCSEKKKDSKIIAFEKVLGERKTEALNLLVSDFETNLNTVYPKLSIDKAYTQYLIDIVEATKEDGNKYLFQSDKTRVEFHESGLWDEIYEMDKKTGLSSKAYGKIIDALFTLKDSDSVVKKFRDNRQSAGILSNGIFMKQTLSSKPDFKNYFHKRVVVLNYSY